MFCLEQNVPSYPDIQLRGLYYTDFMLSTVPTSIHAKYLAIKQCDHTCVHEKFACSRNEGKCWRVSEPQYGNLLDCGNL